MKTFFTKNLTLFVTLFIGGSTFTYVAVTEYHAFKKREKLKAEKAKPLEAGAAVSGPVGPLIKNDEKLQACYESYLHKGAPNDEGSVRFHITITNQGAIDRLDLVENQFGDNEFSDCLIKEIRTRKVTVTPERLNVVINHKFNFKRRTPAHITYEY